MGFAEEALERKVILEKGSFGGGVFVFGGVVGGVFLPFSFYLGGGRGED